MMRHALKGFLLAAALVLAAVPNARATTIAEFTQDQMVDASTYIVRGEVIDVWTEIDERGAIWTRATVEVDSTLKGPDDPQVLVVDAHGGAVGDLRHSVPAAARFSVGEDVLLFLTEIDFGRKLSPVGMFLGKYTVRRAPGDTRPLVMRWTDTEPDYDHRFLPFPARDKRVYLDDLVEQVQTRLDAGWDGKPFPGLTADELVEVNTPERRKRR